MKPKFAVSLFAAASILLSSFTAVKAEEPLPEYPTGDMEEIIAHEIAEDSDIDFDFEIVPDFSLESVGVFDQDGGDYAYRDFSHLSNPSGRRQMYNELYSLCNNFMRSSQDVDSEEIRYSDGSTAYVCIIDEVSLSDYDLDSVEGMEVYCMFKQEHPEYYWLSNTLLYNSEVQYIVIDSDYADGSERRRLKRYMENTAEELLDGIDPNDEIYIIARELHDRIAYLVDYGYDAYGEPLSTAYAHNIVGVLDGDNSTMPVCEGYAKTYQLLLNYLDIENITVRGYAGGGSHRWNAVQLEDGNYYLVDITWDDQTDSLGRVIYTYFMSDWSNWSDRRPYSDKSTGAYYQYTLPDFPRYAAEPPKYTLSYNANGGTGAPAAQEVEWRDYARIPNQTPTRDGYNFLGWSTSRTAQTADYRAGSSIMVDEDTTLYAVWEKKIIYTLSYDANGGTGAPPAQTAEQGYRLYVSSQVPMRPGYDFLGWSLSSDAQTVDYIADRSITMNSNITLYAVWEKIPIDGNEITVSDALITGDTVTFTVNPQTYNERRGSVFLALYDADGRFIDMAQYSAQRDFDVSFEKQDNYGSVKIFWWLDMKSIYPMAGYKELKLSDIKKFRSINTEYDSGRGSVRIKEADKEVTGAVAGTPITISVSAYGNYIALPPIVTDADGNVIEVTDNVFIMPDSDVNITVTFVRRVAGGYCGTGVEWLLDDNGTLTISGSGVMEDYTEDSRAPWYSYRDKIDIVVIGDGVKRISKNAFADCSRIKRVLINKSVTEIESDAFKGCTDLRRVEYGGTQQEWEELYIGSGNEQLKNAEFIYSSDLSETRKNILDYLRYTKLEDNTVTVTGCSSDIDKIDIPNQIEGLPVTAIGENAFNGCSQLTEITIPNSVSDIGDYAFSGCAIRNIVIPDNVKTISAGMFSGCTNLQSVTMPDSIQEIGSNAFYGCGSIRNITIPESTASIGNYAFYNCYNLNDIIIGGGVESIGEHAFQDCRSLQNVYITDLEKWCNITFAGADANPLYYAQNLYVNDVPVTDLTIPDNVTSISDYAFSGFDALTNVTIPDNVTYIGDSAFSECNGLTNITLGSGVKSIGSGAFEKCVNLDSVRISDMAAYLNISFGSDYSNPMYYADKLYLNDKRVTSADIPEGVTQIPDYAFSGCDSIGNVTIPEGVTSIGSYAFADCSGITELTLPQTAVSFGNNVFSGCSGLTGITINGNVTDAGGSLFEGCSALTDIYVCDYNTVALIAGGSDITSCNVYLNDQLLNNWGKCGDSVVWFLDDEDTLTILGKGDMYDYSNKTIPWQNVQKVIIEEGVTGVGERAFYGCGDLTDITISDSVTKIGRNAFYNTGYYNDDNKWTDGVLCIGKHLITADTRTVATEYVIADETICIGDYAFYNCSGLTGVTIPECVINIGNYAFYDCSGLTGITLPESVVNIGSNAFYGCSGLTDVIIPEGVISIGSNAFYGCSGLTSVTVPISVTSIDKNAFSSCSALTDIYYNGSFESLIKISGCESSDFAKGATVYCDGAEVGDWGKCGDSVYWRVEDDNSRLILSGNGNMTNYYYNYVPWNKYISSINTAIIEDGVTNIGQYAFYGCTALTGVTIPTSVTNIDRNAFYGCSALTDVYYAGDKNDWDRITVQSSNDPLLSANITFDYTWE